MSDWASEYEKVIQQIPEPGDILAADEGKDAKLEIELVTGKPPFMFSRVGVPTTVGGRLGWFLQAIDSEILYGWKCIVLPRAREDAIRRFGLGAATQRIKSLRVVRRSQTGNSLLVEIHEFANSKVGSLVSAAG